MISTSPIKDESRECTSCLMLPGVKKIMIGSVKGLTTIILCQCCLDTLKIRIEL